MSPTRRLLRTILIPMFALLASMLAVGVSRAATGQDSQQQTQAKTKLETVKKQIAQLTQQQRATANRRDQLNAAVASQADQLNVAAHAVRESDTVIAAKRERLKQLDAQRKPLQAKLAGQRQALAELLRAAYTLGHGSDLRLLLGDDNIARIGRALTYSRYFQHDRIQRISELMQVLRRLQTLKQRIASEQQAMQLQREQRKTRMQTLHDARDHQRALLTRAQSELKQQGRQLQQLQHNQQALSALVKRLGNVFTDIPGKLADDTPFIKHRGHLSWPLHGKLTRSGDGVTIDARRGSTVRAVAHGRIAFANWMRGYGMLIIVDHGNGWMSLYGDNESLLRDVGDWVNTGDSLGTVGIKTGNHEGIYFGLRRNGKAIDPRRWLSKHSAAN